MSLAVASSSRVRAKSSASSSTTSTRTRSLILDALTGFRQLHRFQPVLANRSDRLDEPFKRDRLDDERGCADLVRLFDILFGFRSRQHDDADPPQLRVL